MISSSATFPCVLFATSTLNNEVAAGMSVVDLSIRIYEICIEERHASAATHKPPPCSKVVFLLLRRPGAGLTTAGP